MAAAGVWEARYLRHGLELVFRRETRVVSRKRYPVFSNVPKLIRLNVERYGDFGDPAATSTNTAYIYALGGHLHMLRLSKYRHVISHGVPGRVFRRCQRTGYHAESSRKQRRGVGRKATVLTTSHRNFTLSIWDLWLCSCEGKILAFGTKGQETWSCSSGLDACWRGWEDATVVFCWILVIETAACSQADTSDSENKSSSPALSAHVQQRCTCNTLI